MEHILTDEQTKEVDGYFGPKQVTRAEFVRQWTMHFGQVFHLADSNAELKELAAMEARISEMAGVRWDQYLSSKCKHL